MGSCPPPEGTQGPLGLVNVFGKNTHVNLALLFRRIRGEPDSLVKRLHLVAQVFTNALVRRRHELSLQESEARLREAADLADLGFYELDLAARAVYVDDRFAEVCGIPPEVSQVLHPELEDAEGSRPRKSQSRNAGKRSPWPRFPRRPSCWPTRRGGLGRSRRLRRLVPDATRRTVSG